MNTTYLLLGSNMGDSQQQLENSARHIQNRIGNITSMSGLYTTAAWGNTNQPDFLNQVIVVETSLTALQTLHTILSIEEIMGRIRTIKNAPRIIDIDILFFNDAIIELNDLTIPHPEIQNRRFVLVPLNEIAAGFKHPVFHKSMQQLLLECPDQLQVKKF